MISVCPYCAEEKKITAIESHPNGLYCPIHGEMTIKDFIDKSKEVFKERA
jgi:hypothetical protein